MFKKIFKWIVISVIALITLLILSLCITGHNYILKAIRVVYLTGHKSAFIDDHKYFDNRTIDKGVAQPWPNSHDYNTVKSTTKLDSIHQVNESIAYLIIKNDSIWFEEYYNGYTDKSKTNSFSMAKSIIAAALGKAVELGHIKSLDDKVKTYLPELKGPYSDKLTIKDLVTMQSGLKWDEQYNSPFSITTKAYFYDNLSEVMLDLPIASAPQQGFKYQSGDTQLLAMVLSKALPTTLSEFVSINFWQPMGAEQEALWQFNKTDGVEKAYCCIASNAKDFARFGKLYKDKGNWNGSQLIDSSYIKQSTFPSDPKDDRYGYGWWLGQYKGKNIIYMDGHLGQYVIAIPEDDIIIIRLGHKNDKQKKNDPNSSFYQYIDQAYRMMNK